MLYMFMKWRKNIFNGEKVIICLYSRIVFVVVYRRIRNEINFIGIEGDRVFSDGLFDFIFFI